jgi:hypothetical protein
MLNQVGSADLATVTWAPPTFGTGQHDVGGGILHRYTILLSFIYLLCDCDPQWYDDAEIHISITRANHRFPISSGHYQLCRDTLPDNG